MVASSSNAARTAPSASPVASARVNSTSSRCASDKSESAVLSVVISAGAATPPAAGVVGVAAPLPADPPLDCPGWRRTSISIVDPAGYVVDSPSWRTVTTPRPTIVAVSESRSQISAVCSSIPST